MRCTRDSMAARKPSRSPGQYREVLWATTRVRVWRMYCSYWSRTLIMRLLASSAVRCRSFGIPVEVVTAQDESFAVLIERLMRLLRMVAVNAAIVMAELAAMPCRMPVTVHRDRLLLSGMRADLRQGRGAAGRALPAGGQPGHGLDLVAPAVPQVGHRAAARRKGRLGGTAVPSA